MTWSLELAHTNMLNVFKSYSTLKTSTLTPILRLETTWVCNKQKSKNAGTVGAARPARKVVQTNLDRKTAPNSAPLPPNHPQLILGQIHGSFKLKKRFQASI